MDSGELSYSSLLFFPLIQTQVKEQNSACLTSTQSLVALHLEYKVTFLLLLLFCLLLLLLLLILFLLSLFILLSSVFGPAGPLPLEMYHSIYQEMVHAENGTSCSSGMRPDWSVLGKQRVQQKWSDVLWLQHFALVSSQHH